MEKCGFVGSIELKVLIVLVSLVFFASCAQPGGGTYLTSADSSLIEALPETLPEDEVVESRVAIDLEQIRERGKLIVLTGYSYMSYFMYKGTPMGYEYELMELFARNLGVRLEVVLARDMDSVYALLRRGEGDIVADNLILTGERDERVRFTDPYATTRQVLVQRRDEGKPVRDLLDLQGREIHVRRDSPYSRRLDNLMSETGASLMVRYEGGDIGTEELMRMVARGEIDYTVADERTARYVKAWYPELDMETPIGFNQYIAWAVRADSPELLVEINHWLRDVRKRSRWGVLNHKYYGNSNLARQMVNCSRLTTCASAVSPYDAIVIRESEKAGWDWRLITALIYQESRFNPMALSWAGASGLMQLMPRTAAAFGVSDTRDPAQSIRGGIAYLSWLDNYWKNKIQDPEERVKFILASYNAGQAHVEDARRLALKYHKNPDRWEDVAAFMLLKANPVYYADPVVRFGYCRGEEPVRYVEDILNRYQHYKRLISDEIYMKARES